MDVEVTIKGQGEGGSMLKNKNGSYSSLVHITGTQNEKVTFADAVTAARTTAFEVDNYKTITLEVYGTSSTRQVNFYGRGASGVNRAIQGVKLSDYSMATGTSGNNELWNFDVTGLDFFVVEVATVTGGNVTVKGKAVV